MTIHSDDDTIAAIATPIGVGGISVIRVSGKDAFTIADKGFRGKTSLALAQSHTVHFGRFVDTQSEILDEVLATVFRSPHSYTSDDTVEISCHGGMLVTKKILEALLSFGARMAEPGEFTKRAFLNGRIDLTQAEAIADLIQSGSESSRKASLQQLEGRLSNKINELRDKLLKTCGLLELELDFTEDGLEFIDKTNIIKQLGDLIDYLERLVQTYSLGKIYREGVKVVLTGKPNVGKSSILNALLDESRAIVTDVPGTTRDVIEESIEIDGLLFKIIDTAGIRESKDIVEREGIRRSESQVEDADIIVFIVDPTQGFNDEDSIIAQSLNKHEGNLLVVQNKSDLLERKDLAMIAIPGAMRKPLELSARTGKGLDELRKELVNLALDSVRNVSDRSVIISNSRQKQSLILAIESLRLARKGLEDGFSNDLIAIDIRAGLNHLGEITGEITTEDILNNIFSKFCIGK